MMSSNSNTIAFVGDLMLGRRVSKLLRSSPPESFWGDVLPILRSVDAVIANFESPITESTDEWRKTWKAFRFRADPAAVDLLKAGNVRCVTLANNHALDYGEQGLLDTLRHLDAGGIAHVGAGEDLTAALQPVLVETRSGPVGVIGMTDNMPEFAAGRHRPGTNVLNIDDKNVTIGLIGVLMRQLRMAGARTVVLSVHWGPNLRTWPRARFRRFARAVIEAGIDIVHGHSAHLFQAVERWGQGLIMYDTGDFLDDYWVFPFIRIDRSLCFVVTLVDGRPAHVDMRPVLLTPGQVRLAQGGERAAIIRMMRRRCRSFGTPLMPIDHGLRLTCSVKAHRGHASSGIKHENHWRSRWAI